MIAILDFVGIAGWGELTETGRITVVIGRTVATHQVDHQDRILLQTVQHVIQTVEIGVVDTGFIFTELFQLPLGHVRVRHAVAGTFTPAVIVAPHQVKPGVVKHIKQTFLMMGEVRVIFFPRHAGEHAGDGNSGFRATGGGLREVDDILLFQLGVGFTRVTI